VNSLKRVLVHHYDPRRSQWGVDLPVGHASASESGPRDSLGFKLLLAKRPEMAKPHQVYGSCIHCHQAGDMLTMEALDSGNFRVEQLVQKWPLPENVGILLNRDDGLLVKQVQAGSPAAAVGLQAGDRLGMAGGRRLFGQADFRGVLHRADYGADTIPLAWLRNGAVHFDSLSVQPGWRATEYSWRKTVYDGVYGPNMGFFPLRGPNADKGMGLSIKPFMGNKAAERPVYQSGLRPNMEIIAINSMNKDLSTRELIAWFRLNHKPGDIVTYTVRGGKQYRFELPKE
jgi:hypothetical protein